MVLSPVEKDQPPLEACLRSDDIRRICLIVRLENGPSTVLMFLEGRHIDD
jgi:hypothetical protein